MFCAPVTRAQIQPLPTSDYVAIPAFIYDNKPITLTAGDQTFAVTAQTVAGWQGESRRPLLSLLQLPATDLAQQLSNSFGLPYADKAPEILTYHYRLDKIYDYLKITIATSTDQSLVEPKLTIVGNLATDFTPPQNGKKLDLYQSTLDIANALELHKTTIPLVINETQPTQNLSGMNNLGITELIAEGVSNFKGSPNNRRHNIATGIEKFKGLIIPQGATFSFDDNLGPVTAEAGFLPELVIDNGTTLPELGGGLCQVSTTTFRAAMAAGLPITARRNHAYPVSYYSPQGTDATIYQGSADLKFVNDTPGAILVWPYERDKNTLVYDFYGTKDGRQVTLEKPVVYDRQDDGSMKATWTREVTNNGATRTDVFKSVYQSPALFHKTETFVSATGTPSTGLQTPKTN